MGANLLMPIPEYQRKKTPDLKPQRDAQFNLVNVNPKVAAAAQAKMWGKAEELSGLIYEQQAVTRSLQHKNAIESAVTQAQLAAREVSPEQANATYKSSFEAAITEYTEGIDNSIERGRVKAVAEGAFTGKVMTVGNESLARSKEVAIGVIEQSKVKVEKALAAGTMSDSEVDAQLKTLKEAIDQGVASKVFASQGVADAYYWTVAKDITKGRITALISRGGLDKAEEYLNSADVQEMLGVSEMGSLLDRLRIARDRETEAFDSSWDAQMDTLVDLETPIGFSSLECTSNSSLTMSRAVINCVARNMSDPALSFQVLSIFVNNLDAISPSSLTHVPSISIIASFI